MRLYFLVPLALLHLSATGGAMLTTPDNNNPNLQRFESRSFLNKLGPKIGQKMNDVKTVVQVTTGVLGKKIKAIESQHIGSKIDQKMKDVEQGVKTAVHVTTGALDKIFKTVKSKAFSEAFKLVDHIANKLVAENGKLDYGALTDQYFIGEGFTSFDHTMKTCDKRDCKRRFFLHEASRWVKQALIDTGVFISEHPLAAAGLFIGASALIIMMISSGSLIPTALEVIGFGAKGPMAGSLAAAVQRQIGAISAGSVFAHLQSAAMGGAVMGVIQRIATRAFVGLGIAGAATFIGASSHLLGQETHFEQVAWKVWERKSQTDSTPELVNQMMHVWGTPTAERCVAYGYREYRAPIRFVPKGLDPMNACLQSSSAIGGIGFKTPLECADERSKDGVVGTWYVQSNETVCLPHWSEFEDEGCMQFGTRRVFSRLMGARQGDDWNSLCETTPARIHDTYFVKPTYCQDKGVLGIYGIFDMPDEECECYCTGV